MMNLKLSGRFKINKVLKKSKARYGHYEEGQMFDVMTPIKNTRGASGGGLYANRLYVYTDGRLDFEITINEFTKMSDVYEIEQVY